MKKQRCTKTRTWPARAMAEHYLRSLPPSDPRIGVHYCRTHRGWHLTSRARAKIQRVRR